MARGTHKGFIPISLFLRGPDGALLREYNRKLKKWSEKQPPNEVKITGSNSVKLRRKE